EVAPRSYFEGAAWGAICFSAFGRMSVAGPMSCSLPMAAGEPGTGAEAATAGAADSEAAGAAAISGVIHVTRPKRDALWKLPCPRIGENATPELFFMA